MIVANVGINQYSIKSTNQDKSRMSFGMLATEHALKQITSLETNAKKALALEAESRGGKQAVRDFAERLLGIKVQTGDEQNVLDSICKQAISSLKEVEIIKEHLGDRRTDDVTLCTIVGIIQGKHFEDRVTINKFALALDSDFENCKVFQGVTDSINESHQSLIDALQDFGRLRTDLVEHRDNLQARKSERLAQRAARRRTFQ